MEKKSVKLSVAIACFNEEQNLTACLSSVASWVDEIVVVDGGSSDRTVQIARSFKAKVIITDNPPIFHINKQKAVDACSGEWILQLDADEIVPENLKQEILEIINSYSAVNGYFIPRKNYFVDHWLKKGGQYPDFVVRLFRTGKGKFPCKTVHEQITIDGHVGYIKNPLFHYSYRSIGEYWKKAQVYTTLTAQELKRSHASITLYSWCLFNFIKPANTFLRLYFIHKGFLDGWYGFLFAIFSSLHFPIAYAKYIHLMRKT